VSVAPFSALSVSHSRCTASNWCCGARRAYLTGPRQFGRARLRPFREFARHRRLRSRQVFAPYQISQEIASHTKRPRLVDRERLKPKLPKNFRDNGAGP